MKRVCSTVVPAARVGRAAALAALLAVSLAGSPAQAAETTAQRLGSLEATVADMQQQLDAQGEQLDAQGEQLEKLAEQQEKLAEQQAALAQQMAELKGQNIVLIGKVETVMMALAIGFGFVGLVGLLLTAWLARVQQPAPPQPAPPPAQQPMSEQAMEQAVARAVERALMQRELAGQRRQVDGEAAGNPCSGAAGKDQQRAD